MIAANTSFLLALRQSTGGIFRAWRHIVGALLPVIMIGCSSILMAQVCCTAAQSESSEATGKVFSPEVAVNFTVTVQDTLGDNFNGRIVTENNYKTGTDSCYFSGNSIGMKPTSLVTGSSWQVDASNQYGPDMVGWTLAAVEYIRANAPAHGVPLPCGATVYQLMEMICNRGTNSYYSSNVLSETITASTEVSCRQGVCSTVPE